MARLFRRMVPLSVPSRCVTSLAIDKIPHRSNLRKVCLSSWAQSIIVGKPQWRSWWQRHGVGGTEYVCIRVCRCAHPCIMCIQREARDPCQMSFWTALHLFFKTEFPSEPRICWFLSCLSTELLMPFSFHHLSTEVSEACHHTQLFYMSSGVHAQGLMLREENVYWLSHSPSLYECP